jgi:YHS domain-containing protein
MPYDPVCGMEVDSKTSVKIIVNGETYYFCSPRCKDKFSSEHAIKNAEVCLPGKSRFLETVFLLYRQYRLIF